WKFVKRFLCHQCTCEFCGNGAHVGYNCPAQVPSIQTLPSFPQQYPCCEDCGDLPEAYQCQPPQYTVNHPIFNAHNDLLYSQNKLMEQLTYMCNMVGQYIQRKEEEKRIEEEQAAKAQNWKLPVCYDNEERSISLKDNIIFGFPPCAAITPILSTEDPDNSIIMENEHLDTISATKLDEFIKSSVENLVPILNQFEDFSDSNNESTLTDDDSFSIDNIEYVEPSPPNSELVISEVMEIVIPEISSGSTTTHSSSSLYDSFIFDLSINPFPPADRSDFYEFADELTHIISLPEYGCFCFKIEPNSGDFTMDVVEDIFPTRVHNSLPTHPTLRLNLDFILSSESLFAYVVWIFLPFLSYSVAHQNLLSFRNKDTIFDPGIFSYHISSFMPDVSHRSGTFIKFKVLNKSPMEISFSTCSPMDQ
nr:hypothetical protein [Tanacetum cinerariifolium]